MGVLRSCEYHIGECVRSDSERMLALLLPRRSSSEL